MEMYNDNTAMIHSGQHPVEPPSLDHDPQVKHSRRILVIVVGINLVSTHTYPPAHTNTYAHSFIEFSLVKRF